MECGATVHTGGLPDGRRRLTASILAGVAAGLLCGLAQAQETKTLSWTPPTERVDGSALSADQLAAHRVLCEPGVDVSVPMPATSWAGVEPGIESCVVRAVDQDGIESADSERVFIQPGQPVGLDVSVVELPPSTGPPGGEMTAILRLEWNGDFSSNVWTAASPSVPTGQELTRSAAGVTIAADSGLGNMRVLQRASSAYADVSGTLDASARLDHTGGALLILIDPRTSSGNAPFVDLFNLAAASNGAFNINRTAGGGLYFDINWNGWNSYNSGEITLPSNPFWLWMKIDPDNATVAQRLQYRVWEYGDSVPGSFTTTSGAGSAATSGNFAAPDYLEFFQRDASEAPMAVGLMVIDDNPDADMSSYLPSSGSTVEAGLATGSEAGAGFDARVVSRADISEATSAGSTHGAIGTIRAAITEGATAQQVAAGVASMAAQLADATLAGAGVTARATVSEAITEPAGAGEAVSRQGEALAQVAASAEADAVLSAYLQAVAALAAGIEAGDSWAARLTAAATFSGAAEAGGEFAEDSVALIAAESHAGAQFAAAVHALAEQLEGATAGAAMAGIVSTLAAFSSASSAGAVFESAMRHADALQAGAEAGAAFSGITGELTGHLLGAVSAAMVVNSAHQARATWSASALAGASFVASGDVSALIGALAFVVAAEQRVFTVPAETRTFIVS